MTDVVFMVVGPSLHETLTVMRLPSTRWSFSVHISLATPILNSRISACTESSRHIMVRRALSPCCVLTRETSHRPDLSTGGSAEDAPPAAHMPAIEATTTEIRQA